MPNTFIGKKGVQDVFDGSLVGNNYFDGAGSEYDQVDYSGKASDYSFTKNADGSVSVTSANGTDTLKDIDGFWFSGEEKWYSMDELLGSGNTGDSSNGGVQTFQGTAGVEDVFSGSKTGEADFFGGGDEYDQIDYEGSLSDYTFVKQDDGSVHIQKADGGYDIAKDIDGIWFQGEQKWYSMEDILDCEHDGGHVDAGTSSISSRVFHDHDADGIQDASDEGIADVTVELKDAQGNVIKTTVTDAQGHYTFDGLTEGDYSVGVVAPNDYKFSPQNVGGDDSRDSDVNPQSGMSDTFRLGESEQLTTVDAGLYKGATIGDQVWWDSNHNGTRDDVTGTQFNENDGFAGIKINLIDANNTVVASTVSGTNGHYQFEDVDPGTYKLQFIAANQTISNSFFGAVGANSKNWFWGAKDVGGNDARDSDATAGSFHRDTFTDFFTVKSGETDLTRDVSVTPIALDLNGDGKIGVTGETSSYQKDADAELGRTVEFDIDADGTLDTIEWFDGSGDGILVDHTKVGADGSLDGSALFGDEGGKYQNGYEKLAAHDTNGDGVVSGNELVDLSLWMDDGDAVLEEGEMVSVTEAGIVSISTEMEITYDDQGRELMQSSATDANGNEILTEDVWFAEDVSQGQEMIADLPDYIKTGADIAAEMLNTDIAAEVLEADIYCC